ncbi:MAG: hypothetical protein C6H99_06575 [Epsilonproteobacteria bacterium]|nr:hypothetical protein [Campylobacterota bacterium]NPA63436.1 hypothetical protein [Campylobacterota bacterium]
MRALFVALALLLAGCGYKSITLHLPRSDDAQHITIIQPLEPVIGSIGDEAQIKLAHDIGSYLRSKLSKRLQNYHTTIKIERVYLYLDPHKNHNNLYGEVIVGVEIEKPGRFIQKRIAIKGVDTAKGIGYEKRIEAFLIRLLDEVAREIEELI